MSIRSITTLLIISLLVIPILVVGCGDDGDDDDTGPTGGAKKDRCITCEGTLNGTRWCDQGDGTVKDMTTGLVWLQDAGCWDYMKWGASSTYPIENLRDGECGLSDGSVWGDWRLPTKDELVGLNQGTEAISSGAMHAFTGVIGTFYWSITTDANFPSRAWAVNFGESGQLSSEKELNDGMVWPVRCN